MSVNDGLNVLLVEDSKSDAVLTAHALRESPTKYKIVWAKDGEQALQVLAREGEFADANRPDVILLDLHIPKVDGHDVLRKIKTNSSLKSIPVFVLTESNRDSDVERSFLGWADNYIVKPIELDKFEAALEQLSSSKKAVEFSQA